jgi:hypothetical protein
MEKHNTQGDSFCLFLIDCLLCFDEMFLHSQESKSGVAVSIVHCPWRVGGKGYYYDQFATVTTKSHGRHITAFESLMFLFVQLLLKSKTEPKRLEAHGLHRKI